MNVNNDFHKLSHKERVKKNNLISTLPCDRDCIEYESKITNCSFWGLNHKGLDANFSANEIEEANAFTLHMNKVAVIPLDFHLLINGWMKNPWKINLLYRAFKFKNMIKEKNYTY